MSEFCATCDGTGLVEEEHDDQCHALGECICEVGDEPPIHPCRDCTPEGRNKQDAAQPQRPGSEEERG